MPTARPYEAVPPEAAEVLRPVLPGLADETIAAIAREVPDYARAMEGDFGQVVRLGVEVAFNRFLDLLAAAQPEPGETARTYIDLGRGEFHAGRSLDALLAAYRVGARLAWRRFVEAGVDGGLSAEAIYALGEAIFAYIDELSAESAEGYAEEQSAAAGESERRRRRLVRAARAGAAGDRGVDPDRGGGRRLDAAAGRRRGARGRDRGGRRAGRGAAGLDRRARRQAAGGGRDRRRGRGAALVMIPDADAPGLRRRLAAAVDDHVVVLGPTVPWPEATASARRARRTHRLALAGRLAAHANLLVADDHLADLLLAAAPDVAADLAASRLAPLAELAPGPRARLEETLAAWLDRPGQVQAVAAALGVHPQTVRYRVRQLRDLFGERLEDPDARFELALALRARG